MPTIHTQCPRIESPCAQLPAFAPGQKSAFCDLCQKRVHNLSAMTSREGAALLAGGESLCVRYARLIPAAALLLASHGLPAQDSEDEGELEVIQVTGVEAPAPLAGLKDRKVRFQIVTEKEHMVDQVLEMLR